MHRLCWSLLGLFVFAGSSNIGASETPRLVFPTPHGDAAIHLLALSDGQLALSGTKTGQLKLWNAASGFELRTVTLSIGSGELVGILPRNPTQAYAVSTRSIFIIELPSLEIVSTIESPYALYSATVSPDGESLWVSGADREKKYVRLLRRGRFPLREHWDHPQPPPKQGLFQPGTGVPVVSNDGRYAVIGERYEDPLTLVRLEDSKTLQTLPERAKNKYGVGSASARWTADGRLAYSRSAGADTRTNRIELINPDTLEAEWSTEIPDMSEIYSPEKNAMPGSPTTFISSGRMFLLDGTRIDGPYSAHSGFSFTTATALDSRHVLCSALISTATFLEYTAQLRKFDRARGSFSEPWSPPTDQISLLTGSSRGDSFFVSDRGKSGKVIQLDRGGLRITALSIPECFDAVYSTNGDEVLFAHGVHDKRFSGIINVASPGQRRLIKMPFDSDSRGSFGNIVLSPSGKLMVDIRSNQTSIQVYDPYTGRILHSFPNGYYSYAHSSGQAAISKDDKRLVYFTSEKDSTGRTANCYDLTTGKKLWARGNFHSDLATFRFSDDGKQILTIKASIYPTLDVLDAETGEYVRQHSLPEGSNSAEAIFNPAGTEIAMPAGDSIIFASTTDGKELRRASVEGQRAERLTYMGGSRLASTGSDNVVRLWETTTASLLGTIAFSIDGNDWAFIHPTGRFEATPRFQEQMYFVQDLTKVPLSAYFESFHTPGLVAQIMAGEAVAAPTIQLKDLTEPPKVHLALAGSTRNLTVEDVPETVISEQATLHITAQSEQSKISEIRLYHNGKLVQSRTRNLTVEDDVADVDSGRAGRTENVTVTLLPGENTFRAVALNEQRTESAPALLSLEYKPSAPVLTAPAGRDGGGMQLHLLVIGLNTYRNPKYNLNYAVPDATAVRDLVSQSAAGIFTKVNVTSLFNEQATRGSILDSFTAIAQTSGPRDVFVFYYAGHGVMSADAKPEFFLAPHELTQLYGADDQLRVKAISSAELLTASQKISAQKQLFLLDACQSAGALQTVAARGASEEKAVAQLARASGTHWITASGSEQFASEFEKLGHGTFTFALLEALGGKADNGDGRVTVNELKAFLETQVPELTKLHKGTPQYPASYGFGQDFPVVINAN